MNIPNWVLFLCGVSGSVLADGNASNPSLVEQWQFLVAQKGQSLVFDVCGSELAHWPTDLNPKDDKEKVRLVLAPAVIRDARELVREAEIPSEKQFWARIDACFRIRDDTMMGPADYVGAVLDDALTRAIAVALCVKLGSEVGISRPFAESLLKLQNVKFPMAKWCAIAQNEFGFTEESLAGVPKASTEEESLKWFWRIISSNDDLGFPANLEKSGSLDLLKSRSLPLLLHRTMKTDILVKTLTVATDYKKRTHDFALDDAEEKIAKMIPAPLSCTQYSIRKDGVHKQDMPLDPAKFSVGERFFGLQVSYPQVVHLLQAIRSKNMKKQLFYDISDMLPGRNE